MKAILLLAGRSRRFWPLTEKSLFPICGKTLAEHQVDCLKKAGCTDITIVVGAHNKKETKTLFPKLTIVEQKDLDAGMQGACLSSLPKMKKDPVLILSANDVIEAGAIEQLMKDAKGADGAILARKVTRYFPGGYLTVKRGRIESIIEKPGEGKEPSKFVNIVAHVHNNSQALLTALKNVKNHRDDGYETALQSLFKDLHYKAVPYEGHWQPVKYPWHLLPLAERLLKDLKQPSIHRSAQIHPTAVIEGNVTIGARTRLLPNAVVAGPCVIGEDCIIGNNALVRGSSVGNACIIGYNSEVKGSVLAGDVWTHMTYLGDSVIGSNVSFGGGCITGNFRLDEKEIASVVDDSSVSTGLTKLGLIAGDGCRFGIQVGTNPGAKVGAGTFVAGRVFLDRDIPDGSFVVQKEGVIHVKKNTAVAPHPQERGRYRSKI